MTKAQRSAKHQHPEKHLSFNIQRDVVLTEAGQGLKKGYTMSDNTENNY